MAVARELASAVQSASIVAASVASQVGQRSNSSSSGPVPVPQLCERKRRTDTTFAASAVVACLPGDGVIVDCRRQWQVVTSRAVCCSNSCGRRAEEKTCQ